MGIATLAHAELYCRDLEASLEHFRDTMGMYVRHEEDDAYYLAAFGDWQDYTLILREGDEWGCKHVAWMLEDEDDFEVFKERIEESGYDTEWVEAGAEPGGDLAVSSLKEVGNIMIGGFIDGWADYLETTIDISTPTYVDVDGHEPLTAVDHGTEDQVLVFRNQLDSANDSANFYLYMAPTAGALDTIVSADGGADAVPLETFTSFSGMIAEGAEQASEDITMMTSTPTEVDVSRLSFVPVEGVPMAVEDDRRTGVVLEFEGMPSGYIAILFDEDSAENVAASLLPGAAEDAGAEMQQSAIQEIGNIITSGFLDGWANTLETTIEISPPTFVDDLGPAIIDPLVTDLAQSQEFAFLIDSTIRTEDDEFTCDIYALPNEHELRQALEQLAPA